MHIIRRLIHLLGNPLPLHYLLYRFLLRHIKPTLHRRIYENIYQSPTRFARPAWPWCAYTAARQAKSMGHDRISILEFGIASGAGLLVLEDCVDSIRHELGVEIEIYGFGLAEGLPEAEGYRDMPYIYEEGFYKTDVPQLSSKLSHTTLVLGDVHETCPGFADKYKPAPVGGIIFDMDYYTSTMAAFSIFDAAPEFRLPRIACYFDDIEFEFTGEFQAIRDYNETHKDSAIGRRFGPGWRAMRQNPFTDSIFEFHDFAHPQYNHLLKTREYQREFDPLKP